jgi:hypothetical protein
LMHRDLDCFRSPTTIVDWTSAESPVNTSPFAIRSNFLFADKPLTMLRNRGKEFLNAGCPGRTVPVRVQ